MNRTSRILQVAIYLVASVLAATAATPQLDTNFASPNWIQQTELTASDGQINDAFGIVTAISGTTMVVGAPERNGFTGVAYVFTQSGGVWTQSAELTASDDITGIYFGGSVAISGNTIVVGAYACCTFDASGAAYVFVKPVGGWANMTETAKLSGSDEASTDAFGVSVAVSGNTVVVASPQHQVGSNKIQGAAYVFAKPGSGWTSMTETAVLTASDGAANDQFGSSVAIQGSTVVVGAWIATADSVSSAGAAYVFLSPPSGWVSTTQTAKLTASDPTPSAQLGVSAAISGDQGTIVVGAPRHQVNSGPRGAAYLFVKPSGGWQDTTQSAEMVAPGPALYFGFVAINVPGTIVAVGAPSTSSSTGTNLGAAYVYRKPSSGWAAKPLANAKLVSPSPQTNGYFGRSVALQGLTVAVGEYGATVNANQNQGAVFFFAHQ